MALLAGLSLLGGLAALAYLRPFPPFRIDICRMTLREDFDGAQLDAQRWNVQYPSGNAEWQTYVPEAVTLADGRLHLTARPQPQQGRAYTSGIITTQGRFTQEYGYFEMRAQVPAGHGLWPAFWLLHAGSAPWNEIDVFEILGDQTRTAYLSNHWPDDAQQPQSDTHPFTGPDFAAGFHTFAVDWEPGSLTWYVDGVSQAATSEHVPAEPMFILANLAVGGQWPGYPDASTHFPADLAIDYIHVYEPGCLPRGLATATPLP